MEPELLNTLVLFMRAYADQCHHGKEEMELFPFLESRGVPAQGCPIGALTGEHVQGRGLVDAVAGAIPAYATGDLAARQTLQESLRGIATLYPNHIWKEDYLLLPMSNKVLNQEDQQELQALFQNVDEGIGLNTKESLEQLAADLELRVVMA